MLLNTVLAPTIVPQTSAKAGSSPSSQPADDVAPSSGNDSPRRGLQAQKTGAADFQGFLASLLTCPTVDPSGATGGMLSVAATKSMRFAGSKFQGAPKNMAPQSDNNIMTFFSKVKPNGKGQSASAAAVEESLPLPQIVDGQTVQAQTAPHDPGSQVPLSVTAETKLPPETTPTENSVQAGGGKFANVPPQASQPLPATLFLFMKMPETPSPAQQSQQGANSASSPTVASPIPQPPLDKPGLGQTGFVKDTATEQTLHAANPPSGGKFETCSTSPQPLPSQGDQAPTLSVETRTPSEGALNIPSARLSLWLRDSPAGVLQPAQDQEPGVVRAAFSEMVVLAAAPGGGKFETCPTTAAGSSDSIKGLRRNNADDESDDGAVQGTLATSNHEIGSVTPTSAGRASRRAWQIGAITSSTDWQRNYRQGGGSEPRRPDRTSHPPGASGTWDGACVPLRFGTYSQRQARGK